MKIIKAGDLIEIETSCSVCKTIFSYNKYDIKLMNGNWIRSGHDSSKRWISKIVKCPICGNEIEIEGHWEYYA